MTASLTLLVLATGCNETPLNPSALTIAAEAPSARVSRVDLGTLGGANSYATDVNDLGIVVGWSENAAGVNRAFRWTAGRGMTELGTLPGDEWSRAISLTNAGDILGVSGRTGDNSGTPVVWASSGPARPLRIPLLPGATFRLLGDHNESGQVTGSALGGELVSHAWVWNKRRGIYDITANIPGGAFESYGSGINGRGLVVGTNKAAVCSGPTVGDCWHGFVWSAWTGYRDLGIPAGYNLATAAVTGIGLSDVGVVVGWTGPNGNASGSPIQPYRWTDRTGFTVLPTFSPHPDIFGIAHGVNEMGTVVGVSADAQDGGDHAAAWPAAGGIVKLDRNPSTAMAVNLYGVVVGYSFLDCCGVQGAHATLWRLGPGRGVTPPIIARQSPRSPVLATSTSGWRAARSGPVGCLSNPRAMLSRQHLFDCIARGE